MTHRVCPWWLRVLAGLPAATLRAEPTRDPGPYVHEGMTVLEPGPGMGLFTLDLARFVGASGPLRNHIAAMSNATFLTIRSYRICPAMGKVCSRFRYTEV